MTIVSCCATKAFLSFCVRVYAIEWVLSSRWSLCLELCNRDIDSCLSSWQSYIAWQCFIDVVCSSVLKSNFTYGMEWRDLEFTAISRPHRLSRHANIYEKIKLFDGGWRKNDEDWSAREKGRRINLILWQYYWQSSHVSTSKITNFND